MALKRIKKELSDIAKQPLEGIDLYPVDGNLFHLEGKI
jgi:ubiquitin-protein ligase